MLMNAYYCWNPAELRAAKDALKASLANRGVLDDIKARIRAEVFSAIESDAVRVLAFHVPVGIGS